MKRTLFIILLITSKTLNAQYFEDFNASKVLHFNQWTGDTEAFEITGDQALRSKTITTTFLSSPNSMAYNAFWEFGLQLDFNPSTQNQLRVYLISDSDSLKKPLNGYFVLIGESGNTDRYQLYKQKGETISLVMSSAPKARPDASKVQSKVRVTRDSVGKWNLYTAQYGEDFVFDESATDNEFRISSHFGIHCRFTSGNSDKFQFDYFQIDTLEDFVETPDKEDSFGKLKPSFTEDLLFIDTFENNLSLLSGQLDKFRIEEKVLLNTEDANSPSYIHVPNTGVRNRLWEAGLEVNGLLTTQNNVRLYLSAKNDSLPGNQQGYYLQIDGAGGNHTYKLYKQNNASRTLIWQSVPFPTHNNKLRVRVRVTCSVDGEWKVYADEYDQGEFTLLSNPNGVSSIVDLSHSSSLYSGWMTRFSSTRTQDYALHYFLINELGDFQLDKDRPYIVSNYVLDSLSIGLSFNKNLDESSASNLKNYWLSANYESPVKSVIEGSMVIISFANSLHSGEYELSVKDIIDTLGNKMIDTLISFYYEAPKSVEPENPWQKLKPDAYEESVVFDSFENELTLWSGELDKFRIEQKVLLNTEDAKSPSYIHVPNMGVRNRLWEAGLEVNGLLTTQNNVRLYLSSTNDHLPGNQHGYHLQIDGGGGNHTYKLYKQNNTSRSLLWQSVPVPTQKNKLRVRVRVTCTVDGEWKIYTDEYDQGEFTLLSDQNGISSIFDLSHSDSFYSGWMTRFSSTRTQDYTLHYFLIKKLDVNLQDISIPPKQESTYTAKAYDVIINEIMADPKNPIGLPEIEYIELKNLSDEDINLNGWTYSSLTRSYQFNKASIPAKSLLILYAESDSTVFQDFDLGNSLGLSTWPPLVNSGTKLTLKNEEGLTIDEVEYKSSYYKDMKKSNGGWSLERIDPYLRCEDDENWKASIDPSGGTPGRENSVNESKGIQNLSLIDLSILNTKQIQISFNKILDPTSASTVSNYRIDNSIGAPDSVKMINSRSLILFYTNDFLAGYDYILSIENMADCMCNKTNLTKDFFIPEAIASLDILINEILVDPYKDGIEFVEIYNNSQKLLNLNTLSIGTVRESDGAVLLKPISDESHLIQPSSYRLLSSNSQIVASHYPNSVVKNFIQMTSFPQLKNSHGTIILQNGESQIDRFDYNENMHDKLIANQKGVSLERTSFNISANEPGNFKSTAATEGYATPGYENSQFKRFIEQKAEIFLKSKTFSPDHDGFEDVLQIDYSFLEEDLMATIDIYNDRGLLIKSLTRNQRLSSRGTLYWDGLMDNSQLAPVGIYILAIEVYNSRGFRKIMRESCVLATKF